MITKERVRAQFEEIFKEPGYSVYQIGRMLERLGITEFNSETIRVRARRFGLVIDLEENGIELGNTRIKYFIPKSRLGALIKNIGISVPLHQLEEAAEQLGYRI
jgi:hypothetical protein